MRALEKGRSGERSILGGEHVDWRRLAAITLDLLGEPRRIVTVPNRISLAPTEIAPTIAWLKETGHIP